MNLTKEKTFKNSVAVLAVGTSIATVGVNTVQAEDVSVPTTNQTEVTPTETVTAETVATAKTNLDEANQNVSNQTEVVAQAQTEVDAASETVTSAEEAVSEAQAIKDQATPEAIAEQETAVSDAETSVATAETTIQNDQQAISEKQSEISNQQDVVDSAQDVVDEKTTDLEAAKADEQQAQAILDGTGATELYEEQGALEDKVANDQQVVTKAQDELAVAQANDQKLATDISTTTSEVSTKTNEVSSDKSTLDQATASYNTSVSNLNSAQAEKDAAQADVDGINTFVISQEYVDTLKAFTEADYGTQLRADLKTKLNELSTALKAQNVYKSNANDKKVTISDPNNLSKELIQELSLFGADLQNQIRALFGTVPVVVTPDSIDMADLVTDGYVADNWGWDSVATKGHDWDALRNAGTDSDIGFSSRVGENLETFGYELGSTTLDNLKSLIFTAYIDFMYSDSHVSYAHSQSISGLSEDSRATKTYIGIDVSSVDGATSIHVNDVSDGRYNIENSNFDTTEIQNTVTPEALKTVLANKVRALNTAQTVYDSAKANLDTAQVAYNTSQAELASLVKELETLKATPLQTPSAQAKLTSAQATLAQDQASLESVNDKIATLEADITTKKANLDKAKAVVAEKEQALASATSTLTTEQAKLATLNSELADLQDKLTSDETALAKAKETLAVERVLLEQLVNADDNLASALAELEEAEGVLAAARMTLSTEIALLDDLKAKQAISQEEYNRLLALFQAQEQAKLEEKRQAIENSGQTAIPVVDENGQIVDYVAQAPSSTVFVPSSKATLVGSANGNATFSLTSSGQSSKAKYGGSSAYKGSYAELPTTGEESSNLAMIGLGVLGLLGLSSLHKKKKA
uniref:SEC10/PgrA surface exclusion domain-containing protein n=1 Tax=Streptococcus pluranimalium TaxID=82348 RepID=UPI003F68FA3E